MHFALKRWKSSCKCTGVRVYGQALAAAVARRNGVWRGRPRGRNGEEEEKETPFHPLLCPAPYLQLASCAWQRDNLAPASADARLT